jgi:hypothetical protein
MIPSPPSHVNQLHSGIGEPSIGVRDILMYSMLIHLLPPSLLLLLLRRFLLLLFLDARLSELELDLPDHDYCAR